MEKISKDNSLLAPLTQAALRNDSNAVRKELSSLLKEKLERHPEKPNESNTSASDDLGLLEAVFFDFDDLIGIKHNRLDTQRNGQLYKHLGNLENIDRMHLIRNGAIKYLTWYEPKSYTQKELLQAIKDYETGKKSTVFFRPPKKYDINFNFTVEKLANKIVAILCNQRAYDAIEREYTMIIEPMYGYKPEVKGKKFKLSFIDCVYVSEFGEILNHDEKPSFNGDFTEWGKETIDWSTELNQPYGELLRNLNEQEKIKLEKYSFGGMGSKDVVVVCKDSKVETFE